MTAEWYLYKSASSNTLLSSHSALPLQECWLVEKTKELDSVEVWFGGSLGLLCAITRVYLNANFPQCQLLPVAAAFINSGGNHTREIQKSCYFLWLLPLEHLRPDGTQQHKED